MIPDSGRDVMQVCANGHVITDLLRTHPEQGRSHCDRCGAPTFDRCQTCGCGLPGAIPVPGLTPVGERRPPLCCPACGASFPWSRTPAPARGEPLAVLEHLLRRLPLTIRQLRSRHGDRPAFCVRDVYDLEDLTRALLPLHFDDIRPECRTPTYALATRTDFFLATDRIALTCKYVTSELREPRLSQELEEDAAYWGPGRCGCLVVLVHDPERRLYDPCRLEAEWGRQEPVVRCVIVS
jgi:hypothetical protein